MRRTIVTFIVIAPYTFFFLSKFEATNLFGYLEQMAYCLPTFIATDLISNSSANQIHMPSHASIVLSMGFYLAVYWSIIKFRKNKNYENQPRNS